jgi:hypothetical protein
MKEKVVTKYETYTHNGKEYKFRVGRDTPKLEMFEPLSSDYYGKEQKALDVAIYQIVVPPFVLFILWLIFGFAGVSIEDIFITTLGVFAFIYFFTLYEAVNRISKASNFFGDLKEKVENKEYTEAYKAWMKSKGE